MPSGRSRWGGVAGLLVLCILMAAPRAASAHPHVWVTVRAEILVDADKKLVGMLHTWTFDQEYSAFATLNLDSAHDGKPDPAKLAELARTQLGNLAEYHFFTKAKVNGSTVAFGKPRDESLVFQDGRLTLRFLLPFAQAAKLRVASVEVNDDSFFVAFNVSRDAGAVRVSGPTTGCAPSVIRPRSEAQEGQQLIPDADAAASDNAVRIATDYVTHIIVACPSRHDQARRRPGLPTRHVSSKCGGRPCLVTHSAKVADRQHAQLVRQNHATRRHLAML